MKRTVVTPPVLPPEALAELKQWLGISTAQDDDLLAALLRTGLDMCETFTGIMPIEAVCEEVLEASGTWQLLSARPVQAISLVRAISSSGTRTDLSPSAYVVDLDANGGGRIMVMELGDAYRIAARFTCGLAPSWDALPEPLRQGVLRLAAYQHRERESSGASPIPPAAVAALWRPWRRLRLA